MLDGHACTGAEPANEPLTDSCVGRYIIGLGLGDEKDITVNGLEAVRKCDKVFLEYYTSILGVEREALEAYYGKAIVLADRDLVESESDKILGAAKDADVALLVVGDPFW